MDNIQTTPAQRRSGVIVGISTSFITAFAGSALNLAIPDMGAHFNMGAASVGWLITAYSLVVAAFSGRSDPKFVLLPAGGQYRQNQEQRKSQCRPFPITFQKL